MKGSELDASGQENLAPAPAPTCLHARFSGEVGPQSKCPLERELRPLGLENWIQMEPRTGGRAGTAWSGRLR